MSLTNDLIIPQKQYLTLFTPHDDFFFNYSGTANAVELKFPDF